MSSCHHDPKQHRARVAAKKPPPAVPIAGSFSPPPGTLQLGVDRQPDGFTCGVETFQGIAELLRLPLRDPDDDDVASYKKKLRTSYKYGTDPADIAKIAREHLKIEARVRTGLAVDDLAVMTNGTQAYVDALMRGARPDRPISIAMIAYQAYVLPDHDKSIYFPKGRKGPRKVLPIRRPDGSIIWESDWSDGHWSAIVRVVTPREKRVLQKIRRQLGDPPRADEVLQGVVVLADPSNGEGLSFVSIPEFEARWHDTDRDDRPRFHHAAVVLTASPKVLAAMQDHARKQGVPMFATVARNAVMYVS